MTVTNLGPTLAQTITHTASATAARKAKPATTAPKPAAGVPTSAKAVLGDFLNQFGLGNLADWAWKMYTGAGGGDVGLAAVSAELPNTTEYKARFPAIGARVKAGLPPITPADYLNYEQTLRQAFVAHGLKLPTSGTDFSNLVSDLLVKDVSAAEVVNDRIGRSFSAVANAPVAVRQAAARLWGIQGDSALASTFLDPTRSAPELQKLSDAIRTAGVAGMSGIDLTRQRAEQLASLGNTDQGLGNLQHIAQLQPLFEKQVGEQNSLDITQQGVGAAFGENAQDQTEIQRQLEQRRAGFGGGGGASPLGNLGVQ